VTPGSEPKRAGDDEAAIERAHDRLVGWQLDEEGARDRGQDADAADGERQRHHRTEHRGAVEEDRSEHHGRDGGDGVGLEQVRRHAGAVADIVADIVGDGRGIARIVLGDAGFDLADEVAADIGALGEDAAAETGEDRDQRSAEAERHHGIDDDAVIGREMHGAGEEAEIERHAEQREARHQEAGDGAGLERDLEAAGERRDRGLRGAHIGAHRDVHADEAGEAREHRPDGEADADQPAEENADDQEDHDADDADGGVLPPQIGLRALAHRRGNFLHPGAAGIRSHHRLGRPDRVADARKPAQDDDHQSCHGETPVRDARTAPLPGETHFDGNTASPGSIRRGPCQKAPVQAMP
jgi:hypothetical protein